jgi:hypothetical protein
VLHFARKEAYGKLNVTVSTHKKPKVNQTFEVDFGNSVVHELEDAWEKVTKKVTEEAAKYDFDLDALLKNAIEMERTAAKHAAYLANIAAERAKEARDAMADRAANVVKDFPDRQAVYERLGKVTETAQKHKDAFVQAANDFNKQASEVIVQAQVRAKVEWLKVSRRAEEALAYERRAAEALNNAKRFETRKMTVDDKAEADMKLNKAKKERAEAKRERREKAQEKRKAGWRCSGKRKTKKSCRG